MALPTTDSFTNFKIYLGDGADPEVFTAPCGFINKALNLESDVSTTNVPDCTNPEDPAWEVAGVSVKRANVNASGVMAEESYETWRAAWDNGVPINVRVEKRLGYWAGPAIVQSLGESVALGSDGNLIQLTVAVRSAGAWTWVPA